MVLVENVIALAAKQLETTNICFLIFVEDKILQSGVTSPKGCEGHALFLLITRLLQKESGRCVVEETANFPRIFVTSRPGTLEVPISAEIHPRSIHHACYIFNQALRSLPGIRDARGA